METNPNNQNTTASTATETASVAPAATGSAAANVSVEPKKNGKGLGVLAAVMACLAVAGVGFGVYGMVQASSKVTEVQDVQVQVKNDDGTTTTINKEAVATSKNANNKTVVTITEEAIVPVENTTDESGSAGGSSSVVTPVNTEDYIYIGEWGIKIKIPDNLKTVSYLYDAALDNVYFDAVAYRAGGMQYFPEFANISRNPQGLGLLKRYAITEDVQDNSVSALVTGVDDEYQYLYVGPQALYSFDEDEIEWEHETTQNIRAMLTNPDNYSSI